MMDLFDTPMLSGLTYGEEAISPSEETELIARINTQPLSPIPFPRLARQAADSVVWMVL